MLDFQVMIGMASETDEKMDFWKRLWKIARVWRVVIICLYLAALGVGVFSWALTGNPYQPMVLIASALLGITAAAVAARLVFSVNIFGRMHKSPTPSGRLFVLVCALGLYSPVVAAIIFASSFVCLRVLQIPRTITLAITGAELAVFSVVGYMGFTGLRRNMRWLSEKGGKG